MKSKLKSVMLLTTLIMLVCVAVAHAQTAPTLPDTAAGFLDQAALWLVALAGLVANRLTERVKVVFGWLKDNDQEKLAKALTDLVAVLVSIAVGYGVAYSADAANWLDSSGVWKVIVFTWPVAWGYFQLDGVRKKLTGTLLKG